MTSDQATVGAFLLGAIIAACSAAVWLMPRVLRFFGALDRMFETINGRPAQTDKAGREEKAAIPSLTVQLADIKQAISDQTEQNERLTALETLTASLDGRMTAIEKGHQIERIAGHVAQTATFSAIETVAKRGEAIDGEVVDEADPE